MKRFGDQLTKRNPTLSSLLKENNLRQIARQMESSGSSCILWVNRRVSSGERWWRRSFFRPAMGSDVGSLFHPAMGRVPVAFEPLRLGDATGHITGSSDPRSGTAVRNNGRHRGGNAFGHRQSVPRASLTLPSLTCGAISKSQQHVARGLYPAQAASGVTADGRANILAFIPCGISSRLGASIGARTVALSCRRRSSRNAFDTNQSLWEWMSVATSSPGRMTVLNWRAQSAHLFAT